MQVTFTRTGERRYGVTITVPGRSTLHMNPAPGYDDRIPHDLVHYLVEAALGLGSGVFGRAAQGGSGFLAAPGTAGARERARALRKQRRREERLGAADARRGDMARSERLALLCDVTYRRAHVGGSSALPGVRIEPPTPQEAPIVARVMPHLAQAAAAWSALPVGGALSFRWPEVRARCAPASPRDVAVNTRPASTLPGR